MKYAHLCLMSVLLSAPPVWGQSPTLLFDFSRVQHQPGEVTTPHKQKTPAGKPVTLYFDNVRLVR